MERTRAGLLIACGAALLAAGCSDPIPLLWQHGITGASQSTPLVTDRFVIFGSETALHIVDHKGNEVCRYDVFQEVISAPKRYKDLILFGSANNLFYAVNIKDCSLAWSFPTRDRIKSDPLVVGDMVYFSSYDGNIYAVRIADHELQWKFPEAATVNDAGSDAAHAKITVDSFSYSSPAHADGVLYIGNFDGYLYAIDLATGHMRWRTKTGDKITSSPLVDGDSVYVGSNDNRIYAMQRSDGAVRWTFKTDAWVNSSPKLYQGTLYCGSNDQHLYAIDPTTGKEKWRFKANGPIVSFPAFYKNLALIAGAEGDNTLYALDIATGKPFWHYKTEAKIKSDPVVHNGKIFVTTGDGRLLVFAIKQTTP